MINDYDNPRPDIAPPKWKRIEELSGLVLPFLAEYVHNCAKDPNERTLAVTLLVTSLCQLTGRRMMGRMPSTIVVNALNQTPDPFENFARGLIPYPSEPQPGICCHGPFNGRSGKNAPRAMVEAILMKGELAKVSPLNAHEHKGWSDLYFAAQAAGFGSGPSQNYAQAWHETFMLMTDRSDEVILRIESPEDRTAFRKDVVENARRLREPLGYGSNLSLIPKHIALCGSLPASDWDAALANSLVDLGMPLLVLPSCSWQGPWTHTTFIQYIASCMPNSFAEPVEEPANFPQTSWFDHYAEELRARLHHLPGTYEYSMQKLARQLYPACVRIANWCGTASGAGTKEIMAMANDLCGHSLRGLMLSVAGLAWHGLGIDTGCHHKEFMRVLDYLRREGPMSKSDLRYRGHVQDSKTRDLLVERFEAEDLVRVKGKNVEATTYEEFVESLYARKELPQPVNYWTPATGRIYTFQY